MSLAIEVCQLIENEVGVEKASKGDIQVLRGEIETSRVEVRGEISVKIEGVRLEIFKLDKKVLIYFGVLLFFIIFLNQNALTFIFKVLGLIK